MSHPESPTAPAVLESPRPQPRPRRPRLRTSLLAHGEPMVWLTGGALALSLAMIVGLLGLILWEGLATFWPTPLVELRLADGRVILGEVARMEHYDPAPADTEDLLESTDTEPTRRLMRTGNFDISGVHFQWVDDVDVREEARPEWALLVERLDWGRFYGTPVALLVDGQPVASEPSEVWRQFERQHEEVRARWQRRRELETTAMRRIGSRQEAARLDLVRAEERYEPGSPQVQAAQERFAATEKETAAEFAQVRAEIQSIDEANDRYQLQLVTADGESKALLLADIVRTFPPNQLSWWGKVEVMGSRWYEFLTAEPREANSEGGVFPAIFGTIVMTLVMTLAVVPFGVLAALYLREYARAGLVVSTVRIAVNNLAGVPSIVFGVFGLGFFCYILGGGIDELFFSANLPNPTFGKGGVLWASLTLALLTLPVVIVATEEALSAVPRSMREGSYACGASKWQTIWRIVLPRALPGIMTGMILAMARGAGEVAPLMLVGAVKLAPELPVDGVFPFLHPQRSFMHLGFHVYDLGFQSQNSEAAKPMVYTTTLLLISIIATLNLAAVWLRARLRRRFNIGKF